MKIALYVPAWPSGSSANGIVTYAGELVSALRRLGHEVFVLTSNLTGDAVEDRYTIDLNKVPIRSRLWARIRSRISCGRIPFDAFAERIISAVITLRSQHNLDVLEIEESFGWSRTIARAGIVPVVVRLHGPWFLNGRFENLAAFPHRIDREGSGIDAATLITAPSTDVLSRVRRYYKLELDLARVIPNPIKASNDVNAWQLQRCDTNRLLFVGRFDRRKGADIVLQAFANLAELYPDLRLSFVGPDRGICEAGRRLSFDQFVRKNLPVSCQPRIDFYGQLTGREINALRTEHFITIVASQFETLSYSVQEAMSLGCPIIATNVGGILELVADGKNGLLFENQNVAQLIAACQELLENHVLAAALGAQARRDCMAQFAPLKIASETISAYQAAIDAFRTRPKISP